MDILLKGNYANCCYGVKSERAAYGGCGVMENAPCAEPYRGKEGFPMFCQRDGQGVTRVHEGCKRPSRFCVQGEIK